MLGFDISERTVSRWMKRAPRDPAHPPSVAGLDIAFATRPQNTVGGDYYDAFLRPLPSRDSGTPPLLIAVADVAGKSVPAALLMATFQASLRALTATPATLDEIVTGLDRYCRAHSLGGYEFAVEIRNKYWLTPRFVDLLRENYVNFRLPSRRPGSPHRGDSKNGDELTLSGFVTGIWLPTSCPFQPPSAPLAATSRIAAVLLCCATFSSGLSRTTSVCFELVLTEVSAPLVEGFP